MHIKNKFKLLVQKYTTVSLFVNEIHLKPYFDYKSDDIVGSSDKSNEVATIAFALMLSSVISQYKDAVLVMQTKCFQAENFLDIIKRMIISFEETGF